MSGESLANGTFLNSLLCEGILICKTYNYNYNKIKNYLLKKIKKIEKSWQCEIDLNKLDINSRNAVLSLLNTYKYLILDEKKDKQMYKEIKKSIGSKVNLSKKVLITKENNKYYLYFGTSVLKYDIMTCGKNDEYFFYHQSKRKQSGLEHELNIKIFNNYTSSIGILTFLKGFLEKFNGNNTNLSNICLKIDIIKNKYIINSDDITGLQIFKCDRFTGFTTLEKDYTTEQITLSTSTEIAIVLLFALASSFVLSLSDEYYFLFFSPEEVIPLFTLNDNETIEKYFLIKDRVIEILREIYQRTSINEIALTEIALALKLQQLLGKYNIDKISFTLFKIKHEGNTYKIYEQIPITIYRDFVFNYIIKKHFKYPENLIKNLSSIFEDKKSRIWKAISSLNTDKKFDEADNALKAMHGLYRFVILGDMKGYYQFIRELENCYEKSKDNVYKKILENLRWF